MTVQRLELRDESALAAARLWWLILLIGVASVAAGVILVVQPSHSLAALAVVFGIFMLLDGIVELVRSFTGGVENRALSAIVGVLGIIVGIVLIRHPTHATALIGLLIGIWLVAAGVIRLTGAIVIGPHRVIRIGLALLETVAGLAIVSDPHIGYTALAIISGIWLILSGIGTTALSLVLRGAKSELERDAASLAAAAR